MRKFLTGLVIGGTLMVTAGAGAHGSNHREVVTTQGTAFCAEDERLVPVRHHGYVPERTGGWVYTCRNWEEKGRMAP